MPYSAIWSIAARADLQLDALPARADDRGVQRAVFVLLRRGDVVLEAPGTIGQAVCTTPSAR